MFEETSEVIEISCFPKTSTIIVRWVDRVTKDGELFSEKDRRFGYDADQKDAFLADVENGQQYVAAMGW